jgi:hypothetical protein
MIKKIILTLLITAVAAGSVFSIDLSAGVTGTFRGNFQTMAWSDDMKDMLKTLNIKEDIANVERFGGGFSAYFDASYVMLSLGVGIVNVSPANSDLKKIQKDANYTVTFTTFDIGLLAKYPFNLGKFSLFPAIGVDFRIPIDSVSNLDGDKVKWKDRSDDSITEWMTEVWFKFGLGADIPLSGKLYLRPMFLYGFGTLNKTDKEASDAANKFTKTYDQVNHGFDFNLAIGFKL